MNINRRFVIKNITIAVMIIVISLAGCSEKPELYELSHFQSERTLKQNREKFKEQLINKTILSTIATPVDSVEAERWQGALWALGLSGYRDPFVQQKLTAQLRIFDDLDAGLQRSLLEAVYTYHDTLFRDEISGVVRNVSSPNLFAMAVLYLHRAFKYQQAAEYLELLSVRFPDWQENPILIMLTNQLQNESVKLPPIIDIFTHSLPGNYPVLFSLQREERSYPGITIIKNSKGNFLRDADSTIFYIRHLTRAASNLPGYLTNGNTPQGIYSLQSMDVSRNVFIGPTPNLQTRLPFEALPDGFFHSVRSDTSWELALYRNLLPASWQNYLPVYEAYYAGMAGRSQIIAHGTTIDPEFYRDQPYYPFTPSLGCLTAMELWSAENGNLVYSDQLKLVNALLTADALNGYLIVLELDDQKKPVELSEILVYIQTAESAAQLAFVSDYRKIKATDDAE